MVHSTCKRFDFFEQGSLWCKFNGNSFSHACTYYSLIQLSEHKPFSFDTAGYPRDLGGIPCERDANNNYASPI